MRIVFLLRGSTPGRSAPIGFFAMVWLCCLPPLLAVETTPSIEVDWRTRYTANSVLGENGAEVSQWSNLIDITVPIAATGNLGLQVEVVSERLGFHFLDFGSFLGGKTSPLSKASVATLQPTLIVSLTSQWSLVGSLTGEYAGAEDAAVHDSILFNGALAGLCQFTKDAKVGFGVNVSQRMSGPAQVIPFPLVDWRIADGWTLTSLDGESGQLSWDIVHSFSLFGKLEFQTRDLRLGRSSSIPSGILRSEAFPLSLGLTWTPNQHLTGLISAGKALGQKLRFADRQGRLLGISGEQSPFMGSVEVDYSF